MFRYGPQVSLSYLILKCQINEGFSPYKFEAPWSAWEFAYHVLHKQANLVILSMAWLTREDGRSYSRTPKEPDMDTLSYWLSRLEPIIRAETEGEIIVVIANRTGVEEEAVYAGSSAVLGIQGGEVKVYGILGRGEKELLVVDTAKRPQAKLVSQPNSAVNEDETPMSEKSESSKASRASDTSVVSINTALTVPDVGDFPRSIADVITPLTPVDPSSPSNFFSSSSKRSDGMFPPPPPSPESLKSSIPERTFSPPVPTSPTFQRPPSPKSRNASRTRPIPAEHQQPALVSHDLAQQDQIIQYAFGMKSPPYSAAAAPDRYQSSFSAGTFGARSEHLSPRPRSAVW